MSSEVKIPSPVGGVPFSIDFAPSILFATLYAGLVGVGAWRLARRSTRTVVSIGNFMFVLERYVFPGFYFCQPDDHASKSGLPHSLSARSRQSIPRCDS